MLEALGALYARGMDPDWTRLFPSGGRTRSLADLPLAAGALLDRSPRPTQAEVGAGVAGAGTRSSELDSARRIGPMRTIGSSRLRAASPAYVADHRVQGQVVFPGAGYVEMALAAASEVFGEAPFVLEELSFEWMLALSETQQRRVQVSLVDESGHRASLSVASHDDEQGNWVRHARATAREAGEEMEQLSEPPRLTLERCPTEVSGAEHYARMEARHIQYGPAFQGVERIWVGTDEVVGRVRLPEAAGDASAYRVHPALLDACFQIGAELLGEGDETFVPVEIAHLHLHHQRSWREAWVRATRSTVAPGAGGRATVDLAVIDDEGRLLLQVEGLQAQRLAQAAAADPFAGCAYTVLWGRKQLVAKVGSAPPSSTRVRGAATWLVFADARGTGAAVAEHVRARGDVCIEVAAGPLFEHRGPGSYAIDPSKPEDYQRLFREVVGADAAFGGVVHCWSLDAAPWEDTTTETLLADVRRGSVSVLHVVQELVWQGFRDRAEAPPGDEGRAGGRRVRVGARSGAGARCGGSAGPSPWSSPTSHARGSISTRRRGLTRRRLWSRSSSQATGRTRSRCAGDSAGWRDWSGEISSRCEAPTFDGEGSYLITGGLGGLGLTAARWLVASGARHILLLGRSEPSEQAREAIGAMTEAGAEVRTWRADVARAADVEGALQYLDENMPRSGGSSTPPGCSRIVRCRRWARSSSCEQSARRSSAGGTCTRRRAGSPSTFSYSTRRPRRSWARLARATTPRRTASWTRSRTRGPPRACPR